MDEQSGVTTIVDYEIGPTIGTPIESMLSAPPVLLEGLALLGKHGSRVTGDGDGDVVLGREDVVGTPTDLGSTKTYLSSMKGDLSTEKTDWAMAKGDLGKGMTKVDLGMTKVDLSEVKANIGKVKVDLNPAYSLFFSNLDLTCPLSLHGWSFKLYRSKPHSESSISPSLDTGRRGLVGMFW
nr:hypothetical protein CFP56_67124 [Quercus suber]